MTDKNLGEPITYAAAGVDVQAGDDAVELMKSAVTATHSSRVLGGFGGFAGMWDATPLTSYRRPVLTTSTDGVGTKVAIAQAMDIHDTIGQDLVGMVVDDIVVVGAKPLFMTDYIATGKVVAQRVADIVRGIATGCKFADTAPFWWRNRGTPGLLAEDDITSPAPSPVLLRPIRFLVQNVSRLRCSHSDESSVPTHGIHCCSIVASKD